MTDSLTLLRAMNGIHEEDVVMAGNMYLNQEKPKHFKSRRIITLALAAALILSFGVAAYAIGGAANSPKAAERVALEELEKWKAMGLLSAEVAAAGEAVQIVELQEHVGSEYWFGRLFPHSYDVRFYGGGDNKYFSSLQVDTMTGQIKKATFEAKADETDAPVRETAGTVPVDPQRPDGETQAVTYYFYDNFDDIFPADMTVDRFCTLLSEYWGFSGYRLADTTDSFYQEHWSAVDGSSLLKDMPTGNYYLTIYFEGDQEGAPMYLQLDQFPGRVCFVLGTGHLVG